MAILTDEALRQYLEKLSINALTKTLAMYIEEQRALKDQNAALKEKVEELQNQVAELFHWKQHMEGLGVDPLFDNSAWFERKPSNRPVLRLIDGERRSVEATD